LHGTELLVSEIYNMNRWTLEPTTLIVGTKVERNIALGGFCIKFSQQAIYMSLLKCSNGIPTPPSCQAALLSIIRHVTAFQTARPSFDPLRLALRELRTYSLRHMQFGADFQDAWVT
jgi:hypothetical protein